LRSALSRHLTPELLAFLERWLPPPPARLLEAGCGDGSLTRRLASQGYDAVGIDPSAPPGERLIVSSLEDFRAEARFDAAVAIRSLHHVGDLGAAIDSLRAALRPAGRLVLYEFAVEHVDDQARDWLAEVGLEDELAGDFSDVIRLDELRRELGAHFRQLAAEPGAYLARDVGREDLVTAEEAAITSGRIRPAGVRLALELAGGGEAV
jgi:SAM-dependent methyltransferase